MFVLVLGLSAVMLALSLSTLVDVVQLSVSGDHASVVGYAAAALLRGREEESDGR